MKVLISLLICFFILGCDSKVKKENPSVDVEHITKEAEAVKEKIDSLPEIATIDAIAQPKECNCKLKQYRDIHSVDITFNNPEYDSAKNDSLYKRWSSDSLVNTIKSIAFIDFDAIPSRYAVFKNIEKISIESRRGNVYGLDVFTKLKSIYFFDSKIDLATNEKWLQNIEVFYAEKTKFTGLYSFEKTPNLRTLYLAYSGFDIFPKHFNKLSCINKLTLGAYGYGKVDLTVLDVSKNKCLTKIDIVSWGAVFNGIPEGLKESNVKDLNIEHPQLTELEKAVLKEIKTGL